MWGYSAAVGDGFPVPCHPERTSVGDGALWSAVTRIYPLPGRGTGERSEPRGWNAGGKLTLPAWLQTFSVFRCTPFHPLSSQARTSPSPGGGILSFPTGVRVREDRAMPCPYGEMLNYKC